MTTRRSKSGPRDRRAPTAKELKRRKRSTGDTQYGVEFEPGPSRRVKPPMKGKIKELTPEQYRRWKKFSGRNRKT